MSKNLRPTRMYVYKETSTSKGPKAKQITNYFVTPNTGCCLLMQFTDEGLMQKELINQRRRGVTLLSKLPKGLEAQAQDGAVTREPYDLSFLSQTSAGYNDNKQQRKK